MILLSARARSFAVLDVFDFLAGLAAWGNGSEGRDALVLLLVFAEDGLLVVISGKWAPANSLKSVMLDAIVSVWRVLDGDRRERAIEGLIDL